MKFSTILFVASVAAGNGDPIPSECNPSSYNACPAGYSCQKLYSDGMYNNKYICAQIEKAATGEACGFQAMKVCQDGHKCDKRICC